MEIAFYSPMKSPQSPRPSGDRKIARLFFAALEAGGFHPFLASELRSWEGNGDTREQKRIESEAKAVAAKLVDRYCEMSETARPRAWFTYHLYHKAPDWIGPIVCKALDIPYFVAEASIAEKQKDGRWQDGYRSSKQAITLARKIICINPRDRFALEQIPGGKEKMVSMSPFLNPLAGHQKSSPGRDLKNTLSRQYKLDPDQYWLLTVAMMREDSKLRSYKTLAAAVERIQRKDWQLIVVGDGRAETLVREYFRSDFERRVHFIGRKDEGRINQLMQAADLFVWPAINEALGMVALEALSNGLPALCGRAGGIGQIIENELTGILLDEPEDDDAAVRFADAIDALLSDPARLSTMRAASLKKFANHHQLSVAAGQLATVIRSQIEN